MSKPESGTRSEGMRLDKWLWCARFYKTRSLAADEVGKGRVLVNDALAKPSRELRVGDSLEIRLGNGIVQKVVVQGMNPMRGPAVVAQQMYEETAQSLAERARQAEQRRLAPEPAADYQHGRPTKKDRRNLDQLRQDKPSRELNERWSAFI